MDSGYMMESTSASAAADGALTGAMVGMTMMMWGIALVVGVIIAISMWKMFVKAGKPGWAAIVPIYNMVVMLQIAGRPVWWLVVMMFVPIFGTWVSVVAHIDFVRSYGKSLGMAVLSLFIPVIGFPMLAFSKDLKYNGPIAAGNDGFMPAPEKPLTAAPAQPTAPVEPQA